MNFEKFTIKAQQAVQAAQELAVSAKNPSVEPVHLLSVLLAEEESTIMYILKKSGVATAKLVEETEALRAKLPVLGDPSQAGKSGSDSFLKVLRGANDFLKNFGDEFVSPEHLLLSLVENGSETAKLLKMAGLQTKSLIETIKVLRKGSKVGAQSDDKQYNTLEKYAKNLNELARQAKLDPVIGRDEEIRRTLHILSRRSKNNPILVGEPGVGKTAIVEGLANRIVNGDVPENLRSKTIYALDMGQLIAGAKYKGEFEERLKSVVKEVTHSEGEILLFIDEIHTLVGAGGGEGAMDAANILKPALARGELRAIGATTLGEYQKYFEKDKALERRFQKVIIDEPTQDDAISILRGLKDKYEAHHHVQIKDEAIIAAVRLSARYISDRFLPDKAIDCMDEAAAKLRLEMNSVPEALDELERKVRQLEIEKEAIKREGDVQKSKHLEEQLAGFVAQRNTMRMKWEGEREQAQKIQVCKAEIDVLRVRAEQAEREGDYAQVAEIRYGKMKEKEKELQTLSDELARENNGERFLKEEVTADDIAAVIAKATGIPPTKLIQTEKDRLMHIESELHKSVVGQDHAVRVVADAIRRSRAGLQDPNRPIGSFLFMGTTGVGKTQLAKSVARLLFDDEHMMTRIDMSEYQEKHTVSRLVGAAPGYVGYEEGGQLTEAVRRKPYSVVLFDEMEKAHPDVFNVLLQVLDDGRLTDNKGRVVNFKNTIIIMTSNLGSAIMQDKIHALEAADKKEREDIFKTCEKEMLQLLRKSVRVEFLNRIDEIVVFHPLLSEDLHKIVRMHLQTIERRLQNEKDITMHYTDHLINFVVSSDLDIEMGARPLQRIVQQEITNEISKKIISGEVNVGDTITLDAIEDQILIRTKKEKKK